MNDRKRAFQLGVLGIATFFVASILILWNSDFSSLPFSSRYQLQMLVDQAPGVAPQTPVRRRGLLIGRVGDVQATDEGALITMDIDEGKVVKTNEVPRIQTSIMGDAIIEFVPVRSPKGAQQIVPGSVVQGTFNSNPMDMLSTMQGDLRETVKSLGKAGDEVAMLAERLNNVMGGNDMQRITRLVESMELAMDRFGRVMNDVDDVIGDEQVKEDIRKGIAQLPAIVEDARAILGALEGVATSAEENLDNLQGLTKPLGERGEKIVGILEGSAVNFEDLLSNAAELVSNINNSEGTLGRLLKDRTISDEAEEAIKDLRRVIQNVDSTITNGNGAVTDVRKLINDRELNIRIRQIVNEVHVLTHKLANDPARAVRGIIDRETPIGTRPANLFHR
ncbi:MlaD family protein [Adhaeretor mobilis]|uniref:Mce related protein n=1 Tax=Adhaeretor mobilis TaxID=1930276 RepID=A0A517N0K9_9BACT|nr:MlaD family protein [Adhaeretor mobilis]QDT00663.1 mce related protein [Adhaeretor mobilis]